MFTKIFQSDKNWSYTIIRISLALVILPHGAQKVFGWFGGYGFSGTMEYFTEIVGLPWIISLFVIMIEFFGSLMLLAGFLTRINAAALFGLFLGIIFTAHLEQGFFMNWFGQLEAGQEGFEYHLLVLGMAAALVLSGGGKYAIDHYFQRRYISN